MDTIGPTKETVEQARSALKAEAEAIAHASKGLNDNLVEAVRRIWRQLLLIWVVVAALAISYLWVTTYTPLTRPAPKSSVTLETAKAPELPVTASPDTFPPFPEQEGLIRLLNQIREAQYKKDIDLFLQAYSPTFPDLEKKKEQTLTIWRRYDYLDMHFHVNDLRPEGAATLWGKITWDLKTRDRKTQAVKTLAKSYQVQFSKDSGQWLIQRLDPLPD